MTAIVKEEIDKFHASAKTILLKKIFRIIISSEDQKELENAIYFLALSEKCFEEYSESYFEEYFKEKNEKYLVKILDTNIDILNYFSDTNIDRIIRMLHYNMESKKINNLDEWVSIVLSERIRKDGKYECLIDGLLDPKSNEFVLLEIILKIILGKIMKKL